MNAPEALLRFPAPEGTVYVAADSIIAIRPYNADSCRLILDTVNPGAREIRVSVGAADAADIWAKSTGRTRPVARTHEAYQ